MTWSFFFNLKLSTPFQIKTIGIDLDEFSEYRITMSYVIWKPLVFIVYIHYLKLHINNTHLNNNNKTLLDFADRFGEKRNSFLNHNWLYDKN